MSRVSIRILKFLLKISHNKYIFIYTYCEHGKHLLPVIFDFLIDTHDTHDTHKDSLYLLSVEYELVILNL